MTQVCDDAILQCCRELTLTLRRTLKSACHGFDGKKPHFRKSTVCGDSISHTRIISCFLYSIQKCSFILWLCLDSLKSVGYQRSLPFSIPSCALWLSSTAAANSVEFLYLSTLLVTFSWCWRAAKISKTCQWQLSPEMIPFFHLALFLLLQFSYIGYILSILNISQNAALLESRSVPWENVRQIVCNYLHWLIDFCNSMQYVWHTALENSENYVCKNSINFLKIFHCNFSSNPILSFLLCCYLHLWYNFSSIFASLLLPAPLPPGAVSAPGTARGSALLCPMGSARALTETCAKWKGFSREGCCMPWLPKEITPRLPRDGGLGRMRPACAPAKPALSAAEHSSRCVPSVQGCSQHLPRILGGKLNWGPHDSQKHILCPQSWCRKKGRANSTRGYFHGVSQPQYDFFFMEPFPKLLQNKLELITNLCIPIHVFCGQECFISVIQTLFIWFRKWTKSTQWNAFVAVDQHVRLTHILLLDFTSGVSSQLLYKSLTLNLSRVSRLQVQVPSAFHHFFWLLSPAVVPSPPSLPFFFPTTSLFPCTGSSHHLFHHSSLLLSGLLFCLPSLSYLWWYWSNFWSNFVFVTFCTFLSVLRSGVLMNWCHLAKSLDFW